MLDVGAGEACGFLPPIPRRQVEIFGAPEMSDAAALVSFFHAGPEAVELLLELISFVEQNRGSRDEIEDATVGTGDRTKKLPTGKNVDATGANGGFHDLL